jgi:hypothetical protein
VWQTSTGHLLAECHINGKRAGWMILDTGASGFVIEPGVADQYELPTFGDLRIAGVAGKVSRCFVVLDSLLPWLISMSCRPLKVCALQEWPAR